MYITQEDFVNVCPAAMTPDTHVFKAMSSQLDYWESYMRDLCTPQLIDRIDDLDATPIGEDYESMVALRRNVVSAICAFAFRDAIPQLDLVLTNTGFGIVSNGNVAPASSERVKALRDQIHKTGLRYFEDILDALRHFGIPAKSKKCAEFFTSLFWRSSHIRLFGLPNATFDDLRAKQPEILAAQQAAEKLVSPELMRTLIGAEASASTTPVQDMLINFIRVFCALYTKGDGTHVGQSETMMCFMEAHLDDFPEYRDSETYKAHHFDRYENKADDTCFFFG